MECSCTLAALRCATLLARVGWGGIIASMYACGTSWCYVDEMLPIAWWWSPWSTCVVNWLGRCECGEERKLQEPNKLIVVGNISKKCPSQMKNRTGPTINARFWDRIYQWIYRHNMSKWDIASRCEMKKQPLQTFRRLLTKLLIWKMTKREAFWHVDVKNTRLCKSVLPCFSPLNKLSWGYSHLAPWFLSTFYNTITSA